MEQYSDLSTPSGMAALVNGVKPFDEYIAMRTGEYEYSILIGDIDEESMTGSGTLVSAARTGSAYGGTYELSRSEVENEPIILVNEYYCYSNIGLGQAYTVPQFSQITCAAVLLFIGMYLFTTFVSGGLKLWRRLKN